MAKSITVIRNAKIVGNNCMSYNNKHPVNPVSLRPVHDAIAKVPKLVDAKGNIHPDTKRINELRLVGSVLPRMKIASYIAIRA